ncbi:uncharacterized protein, partial [Montipora capricornis]|uniref:uncharacterized protein n=1 Tax=Montipora capricornis TaxID=246305 RepID=UPI0035F120CC
MKSFQVVIVAILFMALLMTSDAGKGKCKKQLKKVKKQLGQLKTELQEAEELNNELQNETAELKKKLEDDSSDRSALANAERIVLLKLLAGKPLATVPLEADAVGKAR